MHSAERDLLRSTQRGELTHAVATLAQQAARATAAKAQAISAHYASKSAALDPRLSIIERMAAVARLKDEEAAELACILLEEARRAQHVRRASIGVIKSAQKVRAADLRRRHRAERMVMAVSERKRRRAAGDFATRHAAIQPARLRFRSAQ